MITTNYGVGERTRVSLTEEQIEYIRKGESYVDVILRTWKAVCPDYETREKIDPTAFVIPTEQTEAITAPFDHLPGGDQYTAFMLEWVNIGPSSE